MAQAAEFGRSVGWTIRWSEFQCYPKGTGVDHPSAYFTSDIEDAVDTVREMTK